MDKNTRRTLQQLDKLEKMLQTCERVLWQLEKKQSNPYVNIPWQARQSFQHLYHTLEQVRWQIKGEGFPPEG